jgi:hypothetical protein
VYSIRLVMARRAPAGRPRKQAGDFTELIAAVREQIKGHFRTREAQRRAEQVQKWKANGDYPYPHDPQTEAERAERATFDYVATTIARKIPKSQIGRRTTLALLKVAVTNEPSSVPRILDELMPLPRREQDDLARLLVRTPMSKLIEANTILASRRDFLAAFREMAFGTATSKFVKERKELHKILEKDLWVFGDEYTLLTSDRSLDEVLARHIAVLRPASPRRKRSGTTVRRADGSRGIVDLMLSQQRRGVDRREHLVDELNARRPPSPRPRSPSSRATPTPSPPTRNSTPSTSTGTSGSSPPTWTVPSAETRANQGVRPAR